MLWRAVSYGLPRSFKPKNIPNGHQMSENDIINRWGQVCGSGESASGTFDSSDCSVEIAIIAFITIGDNLTQNITQFKTFIFIQNDSCRKKLFHSK